MPPLVTTITDWHAGAPLIQSARYGVIETSHAQFARVRLQAWPNLVSLPELWPVGTRFHAGGPADRCRLYYNQPRRCPNFLALRYIVSTQGTSFATFRAALVMLDALAELKGIDAVVCDAANLRLSDRLLARLGWQPHKPERWHRNYIRRYYGNYPQQALPLAAQPCTLAASSVGSAALVSPTAAC
jgi:hypothetical protein